MGKPNASKMMSPTKKRSVRRMRQQLPFTLMAAVAAQAWMPTVGAGGQTTEARTARGTLVLCGNAYQLAWPCAREPNGPRPAFVDPPLPQLQELGKGLKTFLRGEKLAAGKLAAGDHSGVYKKEGNGIRDMAFVDVRSVTHSAHHPTLGISVPRVQKLWGGLQMLLRGGEQFQEQAPTEVAALGGIEILKHAPQVACSMCGHLSCPEELPGIVRQCEQCGS